MRTRHLCGFNIFYTLLILLVYLSVLFTSSSVSAHSAGESYIYLRVYEDKLAGEFHIALRDLNNALGLQTPDVKITEDNLADRISEIHSYYEAKVQFLDEDNELPIRFTGLDMLRGRNIWALTEFVIVEDAIRPEVIGIDYNVLFDKDPEHVALLVIQHFWNAGVFNKKGPASLTFGPNNRRQQLSFSGHSVFTGFVGVVKLGISRLWKGIDHILFIIALVLPAAMVRKNGVWRPVTEFRTAFIYMVKVIALFTIAHSVSLSIAALGLFSLPNRLVASAISFSIAIAALEIIIPVFKRKIVWVVFIFGLFHGFGFARDLARSGALSEHAVFSLFGFNLGVEIGQALLVCFMFLNVYLIRQYSFYSNFLMRYSAIALILLGMYWTVDRAFRIGFLKMVAISLLKLIK